MVATVEDPLTRLLDISGCKTFHELYRDPGSAVGYQKLAVTPAILAKFLPNLSNPRLSPKCCVSVAGNDHPNRKPCPPSVRKRFLPILPRLPRLVPHA
eukprot:g38023.t1